MCSSDSATEQGTPLRMLTLPRPADRLCRRAHLGPLKALRDCGRDDLERYRLVASDPLFAYRRTLSDREGETRCISETSLL